MGRISIAVVSLALIAGMQTTPVVRTGDPYKRGYKDTDFPRVQRLAEGVYSYEQLRSAGTEKFTTVSLFVVTSAGVLVADGQGSVAETQRLVDEIAKVTPKPITRVVIGSDHGDHTAGNKAFPANAKYYVHPTSQAILKIPDAELVPDRTAFRFGDTDVEIRFLGRAHTGGDLSVYLPRQKILFMSEIFLNRVFPAMRSAYPADWPGALAKAERMNANIYIPGHGFTEKGEVSKEELRAYHKALDAVIAEATRLHSSGVPVDEAIKQANWGEYASWTLAKSQGPIAIRKVYEQLDGKTQ